MRLSKNKLVYYFILLIVLFVPLHYFLCEIVLSGSKIDNLFRDVVVVLLFILVTRLRFKKKDIWVLIACLILLLFGILSFTINRYPGTLNVLKTYVVPMLFYFVCSIYKFTKQEYDKLLRCMIVELACLGIIGFFQAFVLGDSFLVGLGYPSEGPFLAGSAYYIGGFYGHQRNMATLVSPNTCGVVLAVALIIHLCNKYNIIDKYRNIITIMLVVGLLGTFSRSAMLGTAFGLLFVKVFCNRLSMKRKVSKNMLRIIAAIPIVICLVSIIDGKFLNGIFGRMLYSSIEGTVSGTDESMIKHIEDLIYPIKTVLTNPLGTGFGKNGPMALVLVQGADNVESSVYLMMYEVGIIGAIFVFIPYIKTVIDSLYVKKIKNYVPVAIVIMVLTTYLLLPNIQTYEVAFYAMMFIGLFNNNSIKKIYLDVNEKGKKYVRQ